MSFVIRSGLELSVWFAADTFVVCPLSFARVGWIETISRAALALYIRPSVW